MRDIGFDQDKTVLFDDHLVSFAFFVEITEKGREYFRSLMDKYATTNIVIPLDFNLVISNLNKVPYSQAQDYIRKIRERLIIGQKENDECMRRYSEIPLVGKTIIFQR